MADASVTGVRALAAPAGFAGSTNIQLGGRVLIGFNDTPLTAAPTWTVLDATPHLVARIEISRGRQSERDQTQTGTATVYLNDTAGLFDDSNVSSPYHGKIDGKPIQIQCWNPVTQAWVPQFRGIIDDYGYDLHPSQVVSNIQVDCVDMFDYLAGYQLLPYPIDGKVQKSGSSGTIAYYGTTFTDPQNVDDRIIEILTDAGIPSTMRIVFSGNVNVQPTSYDPGETALTALRDCADAEFPGIANIYVDKIGRFVFHGRYSRFAPDAVSAANPATWSFQRWKLGDHTAIVSDATRAQMRILTYSRARSDLINSAIAYPANSAEGSISAQSYQGTASINTYGQHSWAATDLITNAGLTVGTYPPHTSLTSAYDQCLRFAKFYVLNQQNPGNRIKSLSVQAVRPEDPRASATWGIITGSDISDIVNISVGYPGGTGIQNTDFYIEGVQMNMEPSGDTRFDIVELNLNVSLAAWSQDGNAVFT